MLVTLPLDFAFAWVTTWERNEDENNDDRVVCFKASGFDVQYFEDEQKTYDHIKYQLNAQILKAHKIKDFFTEISVCSSEELHFECVMSKDIKLSDDEIENLFKELENDS